MQDIQYDIKYTMEEIQVEEEDTVQELNGKLARAVELDRIVNIKKENIIGLLKQIEDIETEFREQNLENEMN